MPADLAFERLVDLTKLRQQIEHDCQDLKQELAASGTSKGAAGASAVRLAAV